MKQTITSTSEQETVAFAKALTKTIKDNGIITLNGDLGMGKTVFARTMIRSLVGNNDLEVPSPTFTLLQTYESQFGPISHFDCYRLNSPEDIYEVGWEDAVNSGISIIEWPERLGYVLPTKRTDIYLENVKNMNNHRHIRVERIG